jgi:hypothetical protein
MAKHYFLFTPPGLPLRDSQQGGTHESAEVAFCNDKRITESGHIAR